MKAWNWILRLSERKWLVVLGTLYLIKDGLSDAYDLIMWLVLPGPIKAVLPMPNVDWLDMGATILVGLLIMGLQTLVRRARLEQEAMRKENEVFRKQQEEFRREQKRWTDFQWIVSQANAVVNLPRHGLAMGTSLTEEDLTEIVPFTSGDRYERMVQSIAIGELS